MVCLQGAMPFIIAAGEPSNINPGHCHVRISRLAVRPGGSLLGNPKPKRQASAVIHKLAAVCILSNLVIRFVERSLNCFYLSIPHRLDCFIIFFFNNYCFIHFSTYSRLLLFYLKFVIGKKPIKIL